jgi:hypothetical protein
MSKLGDAFDALTRGAKDTSTATQRLAESLAGMRLSKTAKKRDRAYKRGFIRHMWKSDGDGELRCLRRGCKATARFIPWEMSVAGNPGGRCSERKRP